MNDVMTNSTERGRGSVEDGVDQPGRHETEESPAGARRHSV